MQSQSHSHSNLRFIHHGVAAILSIALHVGIVRLRLPTPPSPITPQVQTPSLAIPQHAVQVRPRPPEQNLTVATPPPTPTPSTSPTKSQSLTKPPPTAQASTPQPAPITAAPVNTSVAVESEVRSQEQETRRNRPKTQPKLSEENPSKGDQPDVEPDSSPGLEPSPLHDQLLALQWDGLISNIQAEESEFGQAQSLQDIFLLFGQDNQFDLFFDQADQPKVKILSYQLFTDLTPQQVWEDKILPTLEKQDSIEITEEQMFAAGKVYRISQGVFVRYLNVVPLHQPQEVVLLEMVELPSKEN